MEDNIHNNTTTKKKSIRTKDVLGGKLFFNIITRFWKIIGLVTLMLLFHIENGYETERMHKKINSLKKELTELRFESIQVASELMYLSKQTEVQRQIKAYGLTLESSKEPPIKIYR